MPSRLKIILLCGSGVILIAAFVARSLTVSSLAIQIHELESGAEREHIGDFKNSAGKRVPELVRLLRYHDSWFRLLAKEYLGHPKVPLLKLTPDHELRRRAAVGIKFLGADARSAVPALIEAMHDSSAAVRHAALSAALEIAPEDPRLIEALADKVSRNDIDAEDAIKAITIIGPPAVSAISALEARLKTARSGSLDGLVISNALRSIKTGDKPRRSGQSE